MRRLVVNLDNELDPWLGQFPNQNEIVRNALHLYKGDITTDTIQGLRQSYTVLLKKFDEHFGGYDESFKRLDKLIDYLETRM